MQPVACDIELAQPLIHSPAIIGGFQENNLRSNNRMLLESFIVSEGLPIERCTKQASKMLLIAPSSAKN
jgi:hypothetical protein